MQRAYLETRVLIGPCGFQTRQKKNQDIFWGYQEERHIPGIPNADFEVVTDFLNFLFWNAFCCQNELLYQGGQGWGRVGCMGCKTKKFKEMYEA